MLPGAQSFTYVDGDSLLRRVSGYAKQGAGFGHAKVGGYPVLLRGLSPLVETLSPRPVATSGMSGQLLTGVIDTIRVVHRDLEHRFGRGLGYLVVAVVAVVAMVAVAEGLLCLVLAAHGTAPAGALALGVAALRL